MLRWISLGLCPMAGHWGRWSFFSSSPHHACLSANGDDYVDQCHQPCPQTHWALDTVVIGIRFRYHSDIINAGILQVDTIKFDVKICCRLTLRGWRTNALRDTSASARGTGCSPVCRLHGGRWPEAGLGCDCWGSSPGLARSLEVVGFARAPPPPAPAWGLEWEITFGDTTHLLQGRLIPSPSCKALTRRLFATVGKETVTSLNLLWHQLAKAGPWFEWLVQLGHQDFPLHVKILVQCPGRRQSLQHCSWWERSHVVGGMLGHGGNLIKAVQNWDIVLLMNGKLCPAPDFVLTKCN